MTLSVYRHCPCDHYGNGAPTWHAALARDAGVIRLRCNACDRLADVNTDTDFAGGAALTARTHRTEEAR